MKNEAAFQKNFAQVASLLGCKLNTIPDIIPLKRYGKLVAHKRPHDAVLITPKKVYCIEFKYKYGKLSPHQKRTGEALEAINRSAYYVVRMKPKKNKHIYTIETTKEVIYETSDIKALVEYFKNIPYYL